MEEGGGSLAKEDAMVSCVMVTAALSEKESSK